MPTARLVLVSVVLVGMALSTPAAWAAKKGGGGSKGGGGGSRAPAAAPAPPRPTSNPALAGDQAEVKKAQTDLDAVRKKLEAAFQASPEYTAALAAQKQAQADYDAAAAPVKTKVHSTPEYQAAAAEKEQAAKQMQQLQESTENQSELSDAAKKVMTAGQTMNKLESAALTEDPKVVEAKGALTEATKKVSSLHSDFETSMKTNEEYVAAKKALDDARQKLASAEQGK